MSENTTIKANKKMRLYNPNRFNAMDSGICYILVLVVFWVIPHALKYFLGDFLLKVYKYDYFAYAIINAFISQSAIFLIALVYGLIRRTKVFQGGGYKAKWDGVQVLMSVILIIGVMMLFYFTHLFFSKYVGLVKDTSLEVEQNLSLFAPLFCIVYLLEIAIFPAIAEEMLFRGIIMRGLEQFGSLFAVICSSAMFSLMHGNFSQIILQFIGGIAIGGVVMITKNYLLGCAMHFTNNLFSVFYTFMVTVLVDNPIYRKVIGVTGAFSILLGVVFTLIGVIYFLSLLFEKEKNKALGKETTNKFEVKKKYAVKIGETEYLSSYQNQPQLVASGEEDDRLFFIRGKYRKLNRKANPTISLILICVGLATALAVIFFG